MNLSTINKEKIQKINEGFWTVERFEFLVEIENDKYYRKFHQKELEAIQTQLIVLNLIKNHETVSYEEEEEEAIDEDDENYVYEIFNDHFIKMKEYQKIVEYLNFLGITKFESIKKRKFDFFEKSFNEDFLSFKKANINIYENRPRIKFLTDNIRYSAFRVIGEIIQSNENNDAIEKLEPYLKCLLGTRIPREIFSNAFYEFFKRKGFDVLFDSFKLGHSFCQYFSKQKICNPVIFKRYEDRDILDSFSKSDFLKKIKASEKNNITFIKVIRPSHCYHCIRSITRTISSFSHKILYLNEKTLIFCKKDGNFADRIKDISKTSVKDTRNNNRDLTYFIVHPEMLNEKDHTFLVEFLDSRLNFISDFNLPKIYVISSLDYRIFCYKHINKFDYLEIQITKDLIEKLCKLSHPDDPEVHCYQLYYSEKAGSGKTYQIIQDFMNNNNCIKSEDHILKSIFVDLNMKKLPKLLNENNRTYSYVHLDLSPELFDNNYEFFDNLWTLAVLGYQINSDGTYTNAPQNIFFEVPTLKKDQYPDGGFISKSDFPIYCDYYHRIYAHETQEEQIKIPENVKKICDELFKVKIENTSELLLKATQIFYPKIKFKETSFVPRILNEINIFMEEFCEYLSIEDIFFDKNAQAIFLLLLRTNFHIWNMDSLFSHEKQPKSFIIMSHQNLFSNERNKNKWILLFFNSIGEENEWNTEYLKYDIGKVNESTFFENKFFKKLLKNPDIEIYSNQTNYDDEQAYFFNIIIKFFYFNNDINTQYRKITDGVILNDVFNREIFDKIKEFIPSISRGKDFYEQSEGLLIHKWTTVFDSICSIFSNYKTDELNLVYELTNNEIVQEISNISLTMTFVKIFVVMIIRIILKQPLILEGNTGVGKTLSVNLLKMLVEIAANNHDFDWTYHQIDCNCSLQLDELLKIIKYELNNKLSVENHIFFFDELNTSPVSNYVINEMNNYYLKQKYTPKGKTSTNKFDFSSIVFIAAINPYIKVDKFSRSLSKVGIQQIIPKTTNKLKLCNITPKDSKNIYEVTDKNKLAYNVDEISDSTKIIILKSDPELFYFDEEDIKYKNKSSEYLPTDEIKMINHIINNYLNKIIQQIKTGQRSNLNNEKFALNESAQTTIFKFLEENQKIIKNIIMKLLCTTFLEIRELMNMKSILTIRDVKRTMQFFILFFTKLIKVYLINHLSANIPKDILVNEILPQSIVLSIMISIVYRFSNETRIKTIDGNISNSKEEEKIILSRCAKFGLNLTFSKSKKYFTANIRSALLQKLMKINWVSPFQSPQDWETIVESYAWMKFMKYFYCNEIDKTYLFKNKTLMRNLFSISSCYSACKNDKNSVIPLLIIGESGTSKTLAIQLFTEYKQKKNKENNKFISTTYLSTRFSESEGINAHYRDCAMFMLDNKDSQAICAIDELGLLNLNETQPLNFLHYYFDKGIKMEKESVEKYKYVPVMSIATSKYSIDYSIMNRAILIYSDLPTESEITESFYFSELESKDTINIDIVISDYKKNYFNNNHNFFEWQKNKKQDKYTIFLQILHELSDNDEMPNMISLHPLYLLFNSIFHNTQNQKDDEIIFNLCSYMISVTSCSPSVSFEKVKRLLDELNEKITDDETIKKIKRIVDDHKTNNFKAFKEIFNGPKNNNFYLRFCEIINEQINKNQNPEKTKTRAINIEEINKINYIIQSEKNNFNLFHKILNNNDDDDSTYQAFKIISYNNKLFENLTKDINNSSYDNYKLLRQFIKSNSSCISEKGLCIRTKNYECLDFIEELIRKTSNHLREERDIEFLYFYPSDFKLSKKKSADNLIQLIIDIINNYKNYGDDTLYYLLIVGNVCNIDAFLDLLNSSNQEKGGLKTKKPLISQNGFTIELDEFPKNIIFCFIMNELYLNNNNKSTETFLVPYLDRLNQLYFDYDQKDEFGIIEKYKKYREENKGNSTPYSETIHDYFQHFVCNLKNVPIPKEENHFAIVFATTDIDESFYNSTEQNMYINWNKRIIPITYDRNKGRINNYHDLVNRLEDDKEHIFTFYWSNEYDKLYGDKEKFTDFKIPLPKPKNYDLLENDGSINKIIKVINNKEESEEEDATKQEVRAIIVTTSPLMEDLKLNSEKGITSKNTLILYDQYISSGDDFQQRIDKGNEEIKENEEEEENDHYIINGGDFQQRIDENNKTNIIIRLNNFQVEHDRYLRNLLENQEDKAYTIIIYHVKNNIIPEGLYTSLNWPVYWIESITNSLLSEFPITEIVECIRFKSIYKDKAEDIYIRIISQIYHDIDCCYEYHIEDSNKISEIFKYIFIKLNERNKSDDKSIIEKIEFNELIEKIEGNTIKDSYKYVDIKREFINSIINQIPFLKHLIQILILNQDTINRRSIEDTQKFILKVFEYDDIEKLFEKADIDHINYSQLDNGGLYFPELIFPEVIKIYEAYNEGTENYPKIDKQVFERFCYLQMDEQKYEDIKQNYFYNYFRGYVSSIGIHIDLKYNLFVKKIKELLK